MPGAVGLNHVSIVARDLEESVRFYVDELGLEPLPTPDFGFPVQWLKAGALQVHVFERPDEPPTHAHSRASRPTTSSPSTSEHGRSESSTRDVRLRHRRAPRR